MHLAQEDPSSKMSKKSQRLSKLTGMLVVVASPKRHKTVLNHLYQVGFKKMLDVWVLHQLTPKNMMDRISICDSLAKRNEIDQFLKRMVTGDAEWVTYDNIVRKRTWSKGGEAAQTVAKPGLMSRKVLLCIWWDWK
ncbi:histone-lysine N-methyltransferase SETMAR [Trichonephila clavipes]|nr:histone-lysine N-methyltransferase SETMAR [Trichonephila clavipes]